MVVVTAAVVLAAEAVVVLMVALGGLIDTVYSNQLVIALEPEAASLHCRTLPMSTFTGDSQSTRPTFEPGTKYLVVDTGDTPHKGVVTNVFVIMANMGVFMTWLPLQTMTIEVYPTVIRLQRTYIGVPGPCCVSAKEMYISYQTAMKKYGATETMWQVTRIAQALFPSVTMTKYGANNMLKGLRLNFYTDQLCNNESLNSIASNHGFFKMKSCDTCLKFAIQTGYVVNRNEQLKIVIINSDKSFEIRVGARSIDPCAIGLGDIKIDTMFNVKILFNTVKQAKVCCGKIVTSKSDATKHSMVQEWLKEGDENSCMLRLTAGNCHGVVHFTSSTEVCIACTRQECPEKLNRPEPLQHKDNERECLLKSLFPGANDVMFNILKSQSEICSSVDKDPRSRRWTKDTIQVALTLWIRSPQGYTTLRNSGMLFLPSENLLQRYKNCFEQHPGLNDNMLEWMYKESKRLNTETHGGIILDEMAIQEDLKMTFYSGKNMIDGLADMGDLSQNIHLLNTHINDNRIATHVMQFLFLSYDGFRFPFAYFPTMGANTPELYINIWDAIAKLARFEFTAEYVCLDGASNNRSLQLMHFKDKDDAKAHNYTTLNPYRPSHKVTFIMDYSHNIKKLRNNIHSSGDHECCTRKLKFGNHYIVWDHWIKAFNWDRMHNPVRVHPRLTNEHIFLSKTSKMRNHLAEDVLNKDMLFLMTKFSESIPDGKHLEKSIELLQHTSEVVDIFRDRRPIDDAADPRLGKLASFETWLDDWFRMVQSEENVTASVKGKMFISNESQSDIISMIRGFSEICQNRIVNQKASVTPAGVNSDVIENFFCQQRTICHGSNTNPTIHQYKYAINSTILGQNAVSKKSNASCKRRTTQPFCFSTPQPLTKKSSIRM